MNLIDPGLVREQFGALDAEMAERLAAAMQADLRHWSLALVTGWRHSDDPAIQRARHALKGLAGNFGAAVLVDMAYRDLPGAIEQAQMQDCAEATIDAILAAVRNDT